MAEHSARDLLYITDVDSDAYASPSGDGIIFLDAFITRLMNVLVTLYYRLNS